MYFIKWKYQNNNNKAIEKNKIENNDEKVCRII